MGKRTFLFVLLGLLPLLFPLKIRAYYTNMPASVVIGQQDFTSTSANQGGSASANTLNGAYSPWSNGSNLIVADPTNNRVLIFNRLPTSNNASADVVIGQQDFTSTSANQGGSAAANTLSTPRGLCSNGQKLVIADYLNNRVLIYNSIPTTNNASADVVIGQTDFTGTSENQGGSASANTIKGPRGAFCLGNKLFVVDTNNNRILIFNEIPTSNNASADVVVGQPDFVENIGDYGGITTNGAKVLQQPGGVWTDRHKLLVSDQENNRLLIFNSVPTSNFAEADVVIGQPDKISSLINQGGSSANAYTLRGIRGVFSDGKRIFIADFNNNRILIYNSFPTTHNASADLVIGQANFTSRETNQGGSAASNTLSGPSNDSVFVISNKLIVADFTNNRVLIFNNVESTPGISISSILPDTDGNLKIEGAVFLGEQGRYSLQRIQANVNGEGFGDVTYKSGGRDNGPGQTVYDFHHIFSPWAGVSPRDTYSSSQGYTVSIKAESFNAEEKQRFYFEPFSITNITNDRYPVFTFKVNKDQWQRIVDNLASYEIQTKKYGESDWSTYLSNIPVSSANPNPSLITVHDQVNGEIMVKSKLKGLPGGQYDVRVVAVDKWTNRQESISLPFTFSGIASYRPDFPVSFGWFPLQINSLSGSNWGIVSSFASVFPEKLTTNTSRPTLKGIAFAYSTVTLLVTDVNNPSNQQRFTTITKPDSTWSLVPTLYKSSIIDMWVMDSYGRAAFIPSFMLEQK